MDDLVWDRCPDCLGLLDAIESSSGAALACGLCGHVGAATSLPDSDYPKSDPVAHFLGF